MTVSHAGSGRATLVTMGKVLLWTVAAGLLGACAASASGGGGGAGGGVANDAGGQSGTGGGGIGGTGGALINEAGLDAPPSDAPFNPDAACATVTEKATPELLPVDIIWVVDNSVSMQPAIDEVTKGLNAFANLIAGKSLDYRVIMLSYRSKTNPVVVGGSNRYGVCIPPPLAGDANCGNGPRYFQSSIDIRSTQPLEQFLGTLGQTAGYADGEAKGGEPWKDQLRAAATKTIVVVSDDNSRLLPTDFENFTGGKDPFNSTTLPPGILDASWGGLFDGYVFSGLYGWGSDSDPNVKCQYSGGSSPPSSGPTYTTLVQKTGGVRAQICAGASAWAPFFDAVAQAVSQNTKLTCELALPTPSSGTLDPKKVNVGIVGGATTTTLFKVTGASACDQNGGWYYDDEQNPTKVVLCPSSCDFAEQAGVKTGNVEIAVQFGCTTIVK
ncbi:MAG: hypothetical protein KC776_37075 [Myxococcales bacterium]|nr:hypothetical protein [Myxococcales bacterium]